MTEYWTNFQIFTLIKRCQFPNIVAGVQGHVFIYFYFPLQFSQTYSESHKIFHLTFTLCCQIQLWKVKTTLYNSICIEIYLSFNREPSFLNTVNISQKPFKIQQSPEDEEETNCHSTVFDHTSESSKHLLQVTVNLLSL